MAVSGVVESIQGQPASVVAEAPMSSSARLVLIDVLRGGAALAVVFHHAINWEMVESKPLWFRVIHTVFDQGYLGVPLFFVISGFCIHLNWAKTYAREGHHQFDFVAFWKRRMKRLYPPYFVALCLSMGLVLLAYLWGRQVALVALYPMPQLRWMGVDFLLHAGMLHGLHPLFDKAGGNPPFWTLAREEYFYVLYFGLLWCRRYCGLAMSFAMVVLTGIFFPLLMAQILQSDSRWWSIVNSSALVLWVQWCLGMLAVEAYCGLWHLPRWCKSGWMIGVWMIAAKLSDHFFTLGAPLLWGLAFFTLLNFAIEFERLGKSVSHPLVQWLAGVGIFSYSLYLIHNPVRAVLKQMLQPFLNSQNLLVFLLTAGLIVVAGYYAAKLFFLVIERRFLNTKSSPRITALRSTAP